MAYTEFTESNADANLYNAPGYTHTINVVGRQHVLMLSLTLSSLDSARSEITIALEIGGAPIAVPAVRIKPLGDTTFGYQTGPIYLAAGATLVMGVTSNLAADGAGVVVASKGFDILQSNIKFVSDDATAADNLELAYDGTGYVGGTIKPEVTLTDGAHGGSSAVLTLDHLILESSNDYPLYIHTDAAAKSAVYIVSNGANSTHGISVAGKQHGIYSLGIGGDGMNLTTADSSSSALKLDPGGGDSAPEIAAMFTEIKGATWSSSTDTLEIIAAAGVDIQAQTDLFNFTSAGRVKAATLPNSTSLGSDGFMFDMSAASATASGQEAASPEKIGDVEVDDAQYETWRYTDTSYGTQWQLTTSVIQHDVEWTEENGSDPLITFTSDNTDIATVTNEGLVEYVSAGTVNITATSAETANSPAFSKTVALEMELVSGTYDESYYVPHTLDATKHILIVYNDDAESDSADVLDYIKDHMPGMYADAAWQANLLALTITDDSDVTTAARASSEIYTPIYNELVRLAALSKPIRHIILLRGVPSRTNYYGATGLSIPFAISRLYQDAGDKSGSAFIQVANQFSIGEYQGETALVSVMDMGSLAATTAYIDKIEAVADASGLQADGITVDGSDSSSPLVGTKWFFDEKRTLSDPENYTDHFTNHYAALVAASVSGDKTYQDADDGTAIIAPDNVIYYASWGKYNSTLGNDWPTGGNITMSGASGWWLGMSVESFNGVYGYSAHGDPTEWFAATAFGGTAYSNTPVGFVGHTAEPYQFGVSSHQYPLRWGQGWNAAECAWNGRRTNLFIHVGWPFVTR